MRHLLLAGLIAVAATTPALGQSISRSTLDNGLTIVAAQSEAVEVAGMALVIGASVGDEPDDLQGARALLQQAIAIAAQERVSENRRPLSAIINGQSAGLAVNTDWDFVEVTFTTVVEELPAGLDLLADSAFGAELTQEQFDQAAALVRRSHDQSHESPVQNTFDLFRAAFYAKNPMGRALYGDPAQFESMNLDALQDFRDSYYVPANAWLCIVSPLPPDDAVASARDSLSELPARPAPPSAEVPEPPGRSLVEVGDSPDLVHASMVIGVPLPDYGDPLYPAGEMIAALLDGRGGRLRRDLSLLQGLGLSIPKRLLDEHYPLGTLPLPVAHRPFLAVHALSSPRRIERVRVGLLRHLLALREGSVTEAELERARQRVINAHRQATERPGEAALYLARRAFFGLGDAEETVAAVEQVTSEDMSRVAQEYFDRHAVGIQMPAS